MSIANVWWVVQRCIAQGARGVRNGDLRPEGQGHRSNEFWSGIGLTRPASKYRNAGQTCVCVNRILAQDKIYDVFVSWLAEAISAFKIGDGFEPGVTIPLIDMAAIEKVEEHVSDAVSKRARVVVGGKRHAFFEPTVLADATSDMIIFREETFGPVAPGFRFKAEEEAIRLANDTEFGLAAYFYGPDIGRVWRVAEALEYGIVGINEGIISSNVAPLGGMK